jgi:hypothetical protein
MTERVQSAKIPRPVAVFLVVVLLASIVLPALCLYQIRSKLDATVWLWGGILIAVIFAISIPIALWRQRKLASMTGNRDPDGNATRVQNSSVQLKEKDLRNRRSAGPVD